MRQWTPEVRQPAKQGFPVRWNSRSKAELRETIEFLIRHRGLVRDIEFQKLESESQKLLKRLREIDHEKLSEELKCFQDVLGLQRNLSGRGETP